MDTYVLYLKCNSTANFFLLISHMLKILNLCTLKIKFMEELFFQLRLDGQKIWDSLVVIYIYKVCVYV